MKILLLQTDIKWADPAANRAHVGGIVDRSPGADLIVLPEMFTTGFATSPKGIAEKAEGVALEWMQHTATEANAAIAGSVAVESSGKYYNRFYFVEPGGKYAIYNKRHLFTYSGENREYTAGDERVVVDYMGFRILLQICYDLRFPVFSRNRGDYDLALYVANWPMPRVGAWETLLRARAIENQCYVAGVNRVGSDPACNYSGSTALIDFLGKPLAEAAPDVEAAVFCEIDLKSLKTFRDNFPALRDADNFELIDE